ncbi:hypothetical protein [Bifidobacterium olomucense]|uniref:Lipoprotein n=1 Tax=Bifidobacterium olomucense TaxID=2675324 RepID=A0A7Y0EWA7_9BIFI|nr:hypothetical protein [Bifidobacterium sp. DSM 109959]NMM97598.1 hypothetical protein [Bifidobacterium sp. DSM 109959]
MRNTMGRALAIAAVMASVIWLAAGCGATGDQTTGSEEAQTNVTVKPGKGETDADGPASKQTGEQELLWLGQGSYDTKGDEDTATISVNMQWRNTGDGPAKASKVLSVKATTPKGEDAKVAWDYQPSERGDAVSLKAADPTLKPGETGDITFFITMPFDEFNGAEAQKNPVVVTVTDNGGNSFQWKRYAVIVRSSAQHDSGPGYTAPDPTKLGMEVGKQEWVN